MTAEQVLTEKKQPLLETGKTVSGAEEERETERKIPFLYPLFSPIWFNGLVKEPEKWSLQKGEDRPENKQKIIGI